MKPIKYLSLGLLIAAGVAQAEVGVGFGVGFGGGYRHGGPSVGVGFGVSSAPRTEYVVPVNIDDVYWRIQNRTDREIAVQNDSGNELRLAPGADGMLDRGTSYQITINGTVSFAPTDRVLVIYQDRDNPDIIKIFSRRYWNPAIGWRIGLGFGVGYWKSNRWYYEPGFFGGIRIGPRWRGGPYRHGVYRGGYHHGYHGGGYRGGRGGRHR